MIVKRFAQAEVQERLLNKAKIWEAILMFGAGTGMTDRWAELGGADPISVYSTVFPTWKLGPLF